MSFQVSPGVNVSEIDLTAVVPSVSTTEAAIAGHFRWGPVEQRVLVTSEDQLVSQFQKPTTATSLDFFTAANFLSYGNALHVVRASTTGQGNATTGSLAADDTQTFVITVVNDGGGNVFVVDGVNKPVLNLLRGGVYTFDQSDATNVTHQIAFKDGAGNSFTQGVVTTGTLGEAGAQTVFTVPLDAPADLRYYCVTHGNYMGNIIVVSSEVVLVKNSNEYESEYAAGIVGVGDFVAKYPGALGNSLKVSVCPSAAAFATTLSGTFSVTSNTTIVTTSANQSGLIVAGDILALGTTAGVKQDVKVESVAANGTSITLVSRYTGETVTANTELVRKWEFAGNTNRAPGTTDFAVTNGAIDDALHIAIIDEDGQWTGARGTVLEVFENVSKASDAKDNTGSTNYYVNVVNNRSRFVVWAAHNVNNTNAGNAAAGVTFGAPAVPQTASFVNGADGSAPTAAQTIAAYDLFRNPEDVDISFVIGGTAGQTVATYLINSIAEVRKDCVVCISPPAAAVVDNNSFAGKEAQDVVAYRNTLPSSTYAVMDSGYKYQYDKYNDVYRYVPLNGDTAGLMVRTDTVRDPWFSPAGFNRGNIKNTIKLAFNPNKAERDVLYKNSINPVVTFPGQGTVLYGDKTLVSQPSAFDRINVRRLFIVLEKAISTAANFSLFEFNDDFTRAQFRNLVEPFLRDVKGRSGVTDFRVVCDTTNNTPSVIDRNEFVGDIFIKPNRSINFIQLNFVAVRTGVEFSEIIG